MAPLLRAGHALVVCGAAWLVACAAPRPVTAPDRQQTRASDEPPPAVETSPPRDTTSGGAATDAALDRCLQPELKQPTRETTRELGWKDPDDESCRPDVPVQCARRCREGEGYGCFMLGTSYRYAIGVEEDLHCAVALGKRGCEIGDRASCSLLGEAYRRGEGVTKDLDRAEQLLAPSCKAGVPVSCIGVAEIWLERGDRTDAAIELLSETCELPKGYHAACHRLGTLVAAGRYVPADPARARTLFERGCKGFKPSCRALQAMDEAAAAP